MSDLTKHKRVNDILFGPLERPALAWMAARLPLWVTPDILTAIGFLATILIMVSYWLTSYSPSYLWLASFGFVLHWFGDSLDGTVARHRKIERPHYGFLVDHAIDALSTAMIFIGIGLSPYVHIVVAFIGLTAYMLVSTLAYILMIVTGVFRISSSKIGPTEFRVIAILINTLIYLAGNPKVSLPFVTLTLFDIAVLGVALLLFGLFVVNVYQEALKARELDDAERRAKLEGVSKE
jgi:archaetidylinositol phosphate synthase